MIITFVKLICVSLARLYYFSRRPAPDHHPTGSVRWSLQEFDRNIIARAPTDLLDFTTLTILKEAQV